MALEQRYLNVTTRAESYLDILMYTPDSSVNIANITSEDVLQYSDLNSLKNVKAYTNTTIATLEENLWLLNAAFINPTPGRTYDGYISNSISDEDGNFTVNPVINIELSRISNIEYFSIVLNPAVKSGYPRQIITTFANDDETDVYTITTNVSSITTLPNIVLEVNKSNVAKVSIEFVGTIYGHRRIRLSSLVFGKMISINQDKIITSDYLDKCSYVPDAIPSRTFSFTLENYDKRYNVDNPDNEYLNLDSTTKVYMRQGYNIYGYSENENHER